MRMRWKIFRGGEVGRVEELVVSCKKKKRNSDHLSKITTHLKYSLSNLSSSSSILFLCNKMIIQRRVKSVYILIFVFCEEHGD